MRGFIPLIAGQFCWLGSPPYRVYENERLGLRGDIGRTDGCGWWGYFGDGFELYENWLQRLECGRE